MRATRFAATSFVTAVIAALVLSLAPLGTSCTSLTGVAERCEGVSLFATDGSWVLVVVSIPVAIAAIPLLIRRRVIRTGSAILLWICCVVGIASVGLYLIPAAILMTVAATRREDESAASVTA